MDMYTILGDDPQLACEPIDAQRAADLQPSDRVAHLASYAFAYLPWHGGNAEGWDVQNALTPSTRDLLTLEAMSKGTPEWMDDVEAEALVVEILNEHLERVGYRCVGDENGEGPVEIVKAA